MSESSGRTGAPWALRGLVVASVLLPLLVFAGGGWLAWRDTVHEADANLRSALAVSEEQATRVLDTHVLLGARVNDLVGDLERRSGHRPRRRTARPACRNDRRLQPGDGDRGDRR